MIKTEIMLTLDPAVDSDLSIMKRLVELFMWTDKPIDKMNLVRHIVGSYRDGHVAMSDLGRWIEDGPPSDSPHFEHTTRAQRHAAMLMTEHAIDPDWEQLADDWDEVTIPTYGKDRHFGVCLRTLITRMLGGGEISYGRVTVAMPVEEVLVLASLCGWAVKHLHTEGMGRELGALTGIKNDPGCDFTKLQRDLQEACQL